MTRPRFWKPVRISNPARLVFLGWLFLLACFSFASEEDQAVIAKVKALGYDLVQLYPEGDALIKTVVARNTDTVELGDSWELLLLIQVKDRQYQYKNPFEVEQVVDELSR